MQNEKRNEFNKRRVTIRLYPELISKLKKVSTKVQLPKNTIVEEGIEKILDKLDETPPIIQ